MIHPHALIHIADAAAASSASSILGILGGIIVALIAVAGGVGTWAALRVGKNAQTLANFRTSAESWENLANSRKAEIDGLQEQLTQAMGTINSLQAKNVTLKELATGHPAVEKLTNDIGNSFRQLTAQMTRIEKALKGAGQ